MGILSRLFGSPDPTAGWPPPGGKPALDFDRGKVGPLHLGDAVEAAQAIGRPRRVDRSPSQTVLEYEGFELEFHDGRLVCAAFDPKAEGGVAVGDVTLSRSTTPLDAQVWFGDPASDSAEGRLRWLDYERGANTLALEFEDGKLSYVQLYGEGF